MGFDNLKKLPVIGRYFAVFFLGFMLGAWVL